MIQAGGIGKLARQCLQYLDRFDTITHNMANVETSGFKARHIYPAEGADTENVRWNAGGEEMICAVDYTQGSLEKTGNVFDCAINGEGYFAVQTGDGIAYTRDGSFAVSADNTLVTGRGDPVLGNGGTISIDGNDVRISGDGRISVDGNETDRLNIVAFENEKALTVQGTYFTADPEGRAGARDAENYEVKQGFLERANVNVIQEMVEMITIQRSLESYQKVIQTINEQNKMATNRIGRLT